MSPSFSLAESLHSLFLNFSLVSSFSQGFFFIGPRLATGVECVQVRCEGGKSFRKIEGEEEEEEEDGRPTLARSK